MNDYLTSLVLRNSEEISAVRPRLPSLFEALPVVTVFAETDLPLFSENHAVSETPAVVAGAQAPKYALDLSPQPEPPGPQMRRRDEDRSPSLVAPVPPADDSRVPATARPPREERHEVKPGNPLPATSVQPVAKMPETSIPPSPVVSGEIDADAMDNISERKPIQIERGLPPEKTQIVAKIIGRFAVPPQGPEQPLPNRSVESELGRPHEQIRTTEQLVVKPVRVKDNQAPAPPKEIVEYVRDETVHTVIEPQPVPRTVAPVTPSVVSSLASRTTDPLVPIASSGWTRAARAPEPARTEPAAAVINVTIGRVEVRAQPANSEAKPPQPQPRSKLMTLDEYLRQRAQGGRR